MPKEARLVRLSSVEPRNRELIDLCKREPRIVIQLAKKFWYFYLKRFIPDAVIDGHSEYVRFITVGRSRTGSNLLRGSLMSHSRIILFGASVIRSFLFKALFFGHLFIYQGSKKLKRITLPFSYK